MSNTMTAHEPIHYLDSILNEEEKRCEYGHQWRNFTISRSGRFKSKNKKRDIVDGNLFDTTSNTTMSSSSSSLSTSSSPANSSLSPSVSTKAKLKDDRTSSTPNNNVFKEPEKYKTSRQPFSSAMPGGVSYQSQQNTKGLRDTESYKSYYETNL